MPTYQETRVRLERVVNGKKEVTILEEADATRWIEELTAEGAPVPEITASQTYTFHEVSDENPLADFAELVPAVQEQSNIVNRGLVLKQQQAVRRSMLQDNFAPVEGAYDLADVCATVLERAKASPEQKAANALSKLLGRTIDVQELTAIIAAMKPAS